MSGIYSLYKPLRNLLRNYDLETGLISAYQFIQYLDFDRELPQNLRPAELRTKNDRYRLGLLQWEFEILIRELILNAPLNGGKPLNKLKDLAKILNTIKRLENDKWAVTEKNENDVLYELVRIAHRQFPWQSGFNLNDIGRYHWLYRQENLHDILHEEYGMSVSELYQIGFALVGHFLKEPFSKLPLENQINNVKPEVASNFLARMTMTISEARQEYQKFAQYNINWPYTFNPLRSRPLLRVSETALFCPIPTFLVRRITNEVYYDLVTHKKTFPKAYGPAVQNMVGHIVGKINQGRDKLFALSEREYRDGKKRKDSTDWIISDQSAHLFIECKGARPRFQGISDLTDQKFIIDEFERVGRFALQAYKSLQAGLEGKYPHWKPDGKPVYMFLVTLEDWQSFGIHVDRHIVRPLKERLENEGVDPRIVDDCPMSFCPIVDLEPALLVGKSVGIDHLLRRKSRGEYPQWALNTYLREHFRNELQTAEASAFQEEWEHFSKRP